MDVVNAELLRLLEEHHLTSLAENQLHPEDDKHYVGAKLCLETVLAIKKAEEARRRPERSPEIRYMMRDVHHVTCLVAAGACTCLEWREKLIAELAAGGASVTA